MDHCPKEFSLFWLNEQLGNDERFVRESLVRLRQAAQSYPLHARPTYTAASSAGGLIDAWLSDCKLYGYSRGRRIEDYLSLCAVQFNGDLELGAQNLEAMIIIKRDEIVALMDEEAITIPRCISSTVTAADGDINTALYGTEDEAKRNAGRLSQDEAAAEIARGGDALLTTMPEKLTSAAEMVNTGRITGIVPTTVASASATPNWSMRKPERYQGYGKPLYDALKAVRTAGLPLPTPRDILDTFKSLRPPEVIGVMPDGLQYYDGEGNSKFASLRAIKKAIDRLIRQEPDSPG